MVERAQDILKQLQQRVRTTVQIVADVAESVGVPTTVTSWLRTGDAEEPLPGAGGPFGQDVQVHARAATGDAPQALAGASEPTSSAREAGATATAVPAPSATAQQKASPSPRDPSKDSSKGADGGGVVGKKKTRRVSARKRSLAADQQLPAGVSALQPDAAIGGSTYLARIVWALGVARAEGAGALRPADIARMVMARSAVSLEPPNVARYIRRSKPTCIKVDRKEGSSSFYRLNAEGRRLFDQHFSA